MNPTNPTVLITGAATGVGRACAVQFAEVGFDVIINYSRSETEASETQKLVEEAGQKAWVMQADVSDEQAVKEMIARIEKECGRLDVLVNNAAKTEFIEHKDLEALTEDVWDSILAVNLKGPFFCMKAAAPLLKQSEQGAIVNVSSIAGICGRGSSIAYCASKGALNTLTKSMALTLAPEIRVNAVCPGPIESRWLRSVMTEDALQGLAANYPIPRPAKPSDIADAVLHLAIGTTLTTGQLHVVDGGALL
ncbi:3-oxoacyl-[acyl-carrier-protein] reductase FabG [Polystyrenella longa]|uniref:3-oxoacyl-[acyl-carrier-protein] reductase FabG n=1 Tax=Polystyrenella longa TaxID=2528007 RepID=A0A518CLV1_9PLAN|nr:SDR family oxidoreductase [Polystyrenella longa]QDU80198.1 3-oxoacyl-[acyl-carrier-protein] reductase FabG [Polystyrenella longa]